MDAAENVTQTDTNLAHQSEETKDKLDEFIAKFSDIITDADRLPGTFDPEKDTGIQSSFDDFEEDQEEFFTDNELSTYFSDDEDDL